MKVHTLQQIYMIYQSSIGLKDTGKEVSSLSLTVTSDQTLHLGEKENAEW